MGYSAIPALFLMVTSLLGTGRLLAADPTLDEVLGRHLEALGGLDKVRSLDSIRKTGTYVYNGLEHPVILIQQRDAGCREEIEGLTQWGTATQEGTRVIRAWDGRTAWIGNEAEGLETTSMPEAEAAGFVLDADIVGSLVDWQVKGHSVELVGSTQVEGIDVIELEVKHANGTVEQWYLDRQTYLPVMRSTEVPDGEFKAAMAWFFDDYREVAGVQMPFYVQIEERLFAREYLFDTIEANVPVEDGFFKQPEGSESRQDS